MSDDPERNGISRLDEMMSGGVRLILDRIACFLYCIRISFTLLQIVGVSPQRSHPILTCLISVVFYSRLASRATRARSVQAVVYLERHLLLFEYFYVIVHS